jgi:hypothetical protein
MLVAVHEFVPGLYRPPVFNGTVFARSPPQTIISLPVQTAVGNSRPSGALAVLVAVQEFVLGLYLPPVFEGPFETCPPQTIICVPVQTAV